MMPLLFSSFLRLLLRQDVSAGLSGPGTPRTRWSGCPLDARRQRPARPSGPRVGAWDAGLPPPPGNRRAVVVPRLLVPPAPQSFEGSVNGGPLSTNWPPRSRFRRRRTAVTPRPDLLVVQPFKPPRTGCTPPPAGACAQLGFLLDALPLALHPFWPPRRSRPPGPCLLAGPWPAHQLRDRSALTRTRQPPSCRETGADLPDTAVAR